MMLPILVAAFLLPAQVATMPCVDTGVNIATAQTQPVRGRDGIVAVLKVSSADVTTRTPTIAKLSTNSS